MIVAVLFNKVRHGIRYWLLRRLPTCEQIVPVISESRERRLGARERAVVALHLLTCIWCVWYRDQLRTLGVEARRVGENFDIPSGHQISATARERILRQLRETRG